MRSACELAQRVRHASLGIRPDQYRIVNHHLMWAIADTLG